MAPRKDPNAIEVSGALFFVRDPNLSTGFFSKWRRFDGLGSFTLPAEAGSTTETALIDGSISFAAPAGVGNISGTVGALNAGPVHEFMENKARNAGSVQVAIVRPAIIIATFGPHAADTKFVVSGTDPNKWIPAAEKGDGARNLPQVRNVVLQQVRTGHILALDPNAESKEGFMAPGVVAKYREAATADTQGQWQGIAEVESDGSEITIVPGALVSSPASAATDDIGNAAVDQGVWQVRNPGRAYLGIVCSVNQFDRGDAQAGGAITSNVQLVPNAALPDVTVEHRLEADLLAYTPNGGYSAMPA